MNPAYPSLENPDISASTVVIKNFDPGQVSHPWLGFGLRKFSLKIPKFFHFCPPGKKNLIGSGKKVPG